MKKLRFVLLMCGLLLATVGISQASSYDYPLTDPIEATILSTPLKYRAKLPAKIRAKQYLTFDVFPDRDVPDVLWYNEELRYAVAYHKKKAPVMILIAGTGAGYDSAKMKMMQRAFYQAGFHVLSLSSPTHPNFIVAASSKGMPGDIRTDAADLYNVMEEMLKRVKDKELLGDFYLTGYSLGGSEAAYVAMLDEERKVFNFKKVLMINPALNIYDSAMKMDRMLDDNLPGGMDNFDGFYRQLMTSITKSYVQGDFVDVSYGFFYQAYNQILPSPEEGKAVIGLSFRIALSNMLFTADVMTNSGYIVPKNLKLSRYDSLTDYAKVAARSKGFTEYVDYVLYPAIKAEEPGLTLKQFIKRNSLQAIEEYLRNSEKIGMITNEDDIILHEGDVDYFRQVFGSRAKIYPHGGHLGNMAYKDNVAYMINFFKGE